MAACAWCGRPFDSTATRLRGRVVCPSCGVATTDPWPTPEVLAEAYGGWYRPTTGRFSGLGDEVLRRARGRLALRIDREAPAGPILDVGAGDGSLVDALRAQDREATGLDPYATRPDFATGPLESLDTGWAGAVFWHSLEHLPAPTEALRQAARLIRPGGLLVIAVPNAASLQARLFGDRWLALDLPRHLVHIPASSLLAFLREVGFEIQKVSYVRGGQVLFGMLHGLVGTLSDRFDLYDAIRRPEARSRPMSSRRRLLTLGLAVVLLPVAAALMVVEVVSRRSGTVYVEARPRKV